MVARELVVVVCVVSLFACVLASHQGQGHHGDPHGGHTHGGHPHGNNHFRKDFNKDCRVVVYKEPVTKRIQYDGYYTDCTGYASRKRCEGSCFQSSYYYLLSQHRNGYGYNDGYYYNDDRRHGYGYDSTYGYRRDQGYGLRTKEFGYNPYGYGTPYGKDGYGYGYTKCCRVTSTFQYKQTITFDCGKDGYKDVEYQTEEPQACDCVDCSRRHRY